MATSSANTREKHEKTQLLSPTDLLLWILLQPIPESWGEAPELHVLQGQGGSFQYWFSPDKTPSAPEENDTWGLFVSLARAPTPGQWRVTATSPTWPRITEAYPKQKLLKPCLWTRRGPFINTERDTITLLGSIQQILYSYYVPGISLGACPFFFCAEPNDKFLQRN